MVARLHWGQRGLGWDGVERTVERTDSGGMRYNLVAHVCHVQLSLWPFGYYF